MVRSMTWHIRSLNRNVVTINVTLQLLYILVADPHDAQGKFDMNMFYWIIIELIY